MNAYSQSNGSSLADDQPEPKRRKVRKGTQSCWECKRRKVRCIFAATTDPICGGCQRRKTTCISQEFPDKSVKLNSNHQTDDRLGRLEAVVERLVKKVGTSDNSEDRPDPLHPDLRNLRRETRLSSHKNTISPILDADLTGFENLLNYETGSQDREETIKPQPPQRSSLAATVIPLRKGSREAEKYDGISRMLLRAWPSQRDLELILSVPDQILGLFHGTMCAPCSTLLCQSTPSPREILQLPPPGSHPVLIARKLLTLATYLQGLSPSSIRELSGLSVSYRDIISSAVETAHSCLACNDELIGSIEGIECLIIESMYHNNAGDLRSSWHAIRRAMLIAQTVGLHRGVRVPSIRLLEIETRARVHPEYMWFRLVQLDRYLSLMLGLPQGSLSNSFADCQVLKGCTPIERMERIDCVAAGWILQRNEAGRYDAATTHKIDKLLQNSSASMPSQWWLAPISQSSAGKDMDALPEIIRTIGQFTHYHLVTQLHLPYLLRSYTDCEYDYSKITAVNASREILVRFISFRGANSITSFCRGINLLAFIACTAICISHIDAHHERQGRTHTSVTVLDSLAHQRRSDRGMMEIALERMESTAYGSKDVVASKTASILTHLLSIEADAALFGNYIANPLVEGSEDELECGGKLSDCGHKMQIYIPYFGTVKIERSGASGFVSAGSRPIKEKFTNTTVLEASFLDSMISTSPFPVPELHSEQEHRPLDAANTTPGDQLNDSLMDKDWQVVPPYSNQSQLQQFASLGDENDIFSDQPFQDAELFVPTQRANSDDRAIQNLDIDCFESLFQGVQRA